jgi:hypothetical protein
MMTVKRLEAALVCSRRTELIAALMSGALINPNPALRITCGQKRNQ